MAYPETSTFPSGWSFPIDAKYQNSWVVDTDVAYDSGGQSFRAVPASNDWAIMQTASFVATNANHDVSVRGRKDGPGKASVVFLFVAADGTIAAHGELVDGVHITDGAWSNSTNLVSADSLTIGVRYAVWVCGYATSDTVLRIDEMSLVNSPVLEPGTPFTVSVTDPAAATSPDRGWPQTTDVLGYPTGWQSDYPPADEYEYPAATLRAPGASGVGVAAFMGNGLQTTQYLVSEIVPAHAEVRFRYLNHVVADAYADADGTYGDYIDSFDNTASGWALKSYSAGDRDVRLVFYPNFTTVGDHLKHANAVDDFWYVPLLVDDTPVFDDIAPGVSGVVTWQVTHVEEDASVLASDEVSDNQEFVETAAEAIEDWLESPLAELFSMATATEEYEIVGAVMGDGVAEAYEDALPGQISYTMSENNALATEEVAFGGTADIDDQTTAATDERFFAVAFEQADSGIADDATFFGPQEVTVTSDAAGFGETLNVFEQFVDDEAIGSDVLTVGVTIEAETEAGASTELETSGAPEAAFIESAAVADEVVTVSLAATNTITDSGTASEDLLYKKPGAIAWVLNTETTAASWYSNFQFVDLVQSGDTVYAVGPEGVHVLGGGTDNGETIDARVQYGFSDFGTEFKKRVDSFRFGYASDGLLSMDVETYGQGDDVYTYEMEKRTAEQPRNNRIIPGKGLLSRYWRLTIRNIDGAGFSVDDSAADVAVTTRRL